MSNLNFRSRPVDDRKAIPIIVDDTLADLLATNMYANSRTPASVPTGIEKEEEGEVHLQDAMRCQRAISQAAQAVIPVPELENIPEKLYQQQIAHRNFSLPAAFIKKEIISLEDEAPSANYDTDTADVAFIEGFNGRISLMSDRLCISAFEKRMEQLERLFSRCKDVKKVKQMFNPQNKMETEVYDHWLRKRQKLENINFSLVPVVRTFESQLPSINLLLPTNNGGSIAEAGGNAIKNDPYVAFRRRIQKMQTRKNRKTDECRYVSAMRMNHRIHASTNLLNEVLKREELKVESDEMLLKLFRYKFLYFNSHSHKELLGTRKELENPNYCFFGMGDSFLKLRPGKNNEKKAAKEKESVDRYARIKELYLRTIHESQLKK